MCDEVYELFRETPPRRVLPHSSRTLVNRSYTYNLIQPYELLFSFRLEKLFGKLDYKKNFCNKQKIIVYCDDFKDRSDT